MTDPLAARRREVARALADAARSAGAPDDFTPELERPREPEHGDLATNAAMVLAGRLGRPPREIAGEMADALDAEGTGVASVEVAGPGFLNLRFADHVYFEGLAGVLEEDGSWGRTPTGAPERVNVEFVSANPTGPLHVAHGRGAAVGDAVASLLTWSDHDVTREFYVNDAGRQIELLGESVEARWRELRGEEADVPEGGYHGGYVRELARELPAEAAEGELEAMERGDRAAWFADRSAASLLEEHDRDLRDFGVEMDRYRRESELYGEGRVERTLERLDEEGLVYREEGAAWLATTRFGDEKDRVLVKSDGSYTYYLPDIAYHLDKAERGFERALDVWGADHHGHVTRMRAALEGLGRDPTWLEVLILQLVTVLRGGEEVRMSKRAGHFVTLRELFEETGADVARWFFLMRRAEQHLNFDLDLALDTSERNPVYKVQYAHARMCSVFEKGGVDPATLDPSPEELRRLDTGAERGVARELLRFPEVVDEAAEARAPYRLCQYLEDTAGRVNAWYHEGNLDRSLRVLAEGPTRPGRLALSRAIQVTLRNGLRVLGVSAPERMARDETGSGDVAGARA